MSDHPITPPPELVRQWLLEYYGSDLGEMGPDEMYLARYGAQWGADQELEACCQWLDFNHSASAARNLRTARRPSLKEQALAELTEWENIMDIAPDSPIRRALEQLDD
jgi:hypothetical protein